VGGTRVSTTDEAVNLLHSETPDPVTLTLLRGEQPYVATVGRERSSLLLDSHRKLLSNGMVAPLDATEGEMKAKLEALAPSRFVGRVFPTHYPSDESLYYPGFEILILKDPDQVAVLGIEDGPAQRAGIHWGDTILSVNGVDPRNKSVPELERLFSSDRPATMTLKIERSGTAKDLTFQLVQAAKLLRENQYQLLDGTLVPRGLPEKYLFCFR
jgi:C-terminal processing protease CtpA/Prc